MTTTDTEGEAARLGPCIVCGAEGYSMSMGGPSICPKCDCGHFDVATVYSQSKRIATLSRQLAEAQAELLMWRASFPASAEAVKRDALSQAAAMGTTK